MENTYSWAYYGMGKEWEPARRWEALLPKYQAILDSLPPEKWEILADCECCQADFSFTRTMLAYELGRKTPRIWIRGKEY